MTTPQTPTKKRRGAPLGNRNAFKHGFYARQFNHLNLAGLSNPQSDDLDTHIDLIRLSTRRLLESSDSFTDFQSALAALRAVTQASLAFSRLLRTRFLIHGLPGIGSSVSTGRPCGSRQARPSRPERPQPQP